MKKIFSACGLCLAAALASAPAFAMMHTPPGGGASAVQEETHADRTHSSAQKEQREGERPALSVPVRAPRHDDR